MKRSLWGWGLVALLTMTLLVITNAIILKPATLTLRVLTETSEEPVQTTTPQPVPLSQDHALAETAGDEPADTSGAHHDSILLYVPGEFVQLLPQSPRTVTIPGVIKGTVKLSNPYSRFWRVTIEGTVVLANGTTQQVLTPRTLWMPPNQTLQRPVELEIDSKQFVPGLTQFRAILKDDQGRIIDQASVTFTLTVDFP